MILDDKVAIVTGAGSGVGRATALGLAECGCHVIVNDLDEGSAEAVAALARELNVNSVAVQGDVSKDSDCRALVAEANSAFGRLDLLVNNAGTTTLIPHAELDKVTDELWERTQNVNLKGPFQCARAAAALLKADGGGEIVNVSSFAGIYGIGSSIPYCASKAGVNILTVILARVLGPSIRVNAVAPGPIEGAWLSNALGPKFETVMNALKEKSLLGKVCAPEDVRDAILGLVAGSDMVTGQVLIVDGGLGIGR